MNILNRYWLVVLFWWEAYPAFWFRQLLRGTTQTFLQITNFIGIEVQVSDRLRMTAEQRLAFEQGRLSFERDRRLLRSKGLEIDKELAMKEGFDGITKGIRKLPFEISEEEKEQLLWEVERINEDINELVYSYYDGNMDRYIQNKSQNRYLTDIRTEKGQEVHVTLDLKTGKETRVYLDGNTTAAA